MAKAKNKPSTTKAAHKFGCKFGNVNIGEDSCRLPLKIDRSKVDLDTASQLFCSTRITARVVLPPGNGETKSIKGMENDLVIESVWDTKSIGVSSKSISTGLTGVLKDIDLGDLAKFAKREGRIEVLDVEEIESEDEDHDNGAAA